MGSSVSASRPKVKGPVRPPGFCAAKARMWAAIRAGTCEGTRVSMFQGFLTFEEAANAAVGKPVAQEGEGLRLAMCCRGLRLQEASVLPVPSNRNGPTLRPDPTSRNRHYRQTTRNDRES